MVLGDLHISTLILKDLVKVSVRAFGTLTVYPPITGLGATKEGECA
jgi:hypothetical protein